MPIAIGDIHGCLEPLRRLVNRLPVGEDLIFLGDYVDRGPHSAGVLTYLGQLARRRPCRFLRGNHEEMMETAAADRNEIPVWMWNGGVATLESYGVDPAAWKRSRDREEIFERHRGFLAGLEPYAEDERTIFVHGGIDLDIPEMARQDPRVLVWVRDKFFRHGERWKGKEIIFGHTPTQTMGLPLGKPFLAPPLFGIDTGCVYGGRLTAFDSRSHIVYQEPSDFRYR